MKVKDFLKKVNYASSKQPVYLQEGACGARRKCNPSDYSGFFFAEQDRTVMSFSLKDNAVVVHYK